MIMTTKRKIHEPSIRTNIKLWEKNYNLIQQMMEFNDLCRQDIVNIIIEDWHERVTQRE